VCAALGGEERGGPLAQQFDVEGKGAVARRLEVAHRRGQRRDPLGPETERPADVSAAGHLGPAGQHVGQEEPLADDGFSYLDPDRAHFDGTGQCARCGVEASLGERADTVGVGACQQFGSAFDAHRHGV